MIEKRIRLTEQQLTGLEKLAKKRHVSVSALISEGVDAVLRSEGRPTDAELRQRALRAAGRFRSGLSDLAVHHDDYLAEAFDK